MQRLYNPFVLFLLCLVSIFFLLLFGFVFLKKPVTLFGLCVPCALSLSGLCEHRWRSLAQLWIFDTPHTECGFNALSLQGLGDTWPPLISRGTVRVWSFTNTNVFGFISTPSCILKAKLLLCSHVNHKDCISLTTSSPREEFCNFIIHQSTENYERIKSAKHFKPRLVWL